MTNAVSKNYFGGSNSYGNPFQLYTNQYTIGFTPWLTGPDPALPAPPRKKPPCHAACPPCTAHGCKTGQKIAHTTTAHTTVHRAQQFHEPMHTENLYTMYGYDTVAELADPNRERELQAKMESVYAPYKAFAERILKTGEKMVMGGAWSGKATNTTYATDEGAVELRNGATGVEEIVIKQRDESGNFTVVAAVGMSIVFDRGARNAAPEEHAHIQAVIARMTNAALATRTA